MRKRSTGLDFTKRTDNNPAVRHKGVFIIALCCCFLFVGAFSFMWLWRSVDYDFNNMFAQHETTEASTQPATSENAVPLIGQVSLLFVHTSDGGGVLRSVSELKADVESGSIELYPCPIDALCVYNSRSMTVEECYKTYGPKALCTAVKGVTGFEAKRFFRIRDAGFVNIVKLLGDINYKCDTAISYTSDELVLELSAGEQQINPSNALKLVKYNNTVKGAKDAAVSNSLLLGAAVCSYYTEANAAKGAELFSSVVNLGETDISVIDYTDAKEIIAAFAASPTRQTPVIISDGVLTSPFTTLPTEVLTGE